MTSTHPTPGRSEQPDQGCPTSASTPGARRAFVEPRDDGVARDTESVLEIRQTAAPTISTQNLCPLLGGIAVWLWMLAAAAPTVAAQIALLVIARASVADDVLAAAVLTFDFDRNHNGKTRLSPLIHYPRGYSRLAASRPGQSTLPGASRDYQLFPRRCWGGY